MTGGIDKRLEKRGFSGSRPARGAVTIDTGVPLAYLEVAVLIIDRAG